MHDALGVGRLDRAGQLSGLMQGLGDGQASTAEPLGQRLALDQFHDQRGAARALFDAVNRGDVGVIQRRQAPRLPFEPRQSIGVSSHGVRQNLDGNVAAEPRIPRPIDLAHASGTEGPDNLIRSDARADRQGHAAGWILAGFPPPIPEPRLGPFRALRSTAMNNDHYCGQNPC